MKQDKKQPDSTAEPVAIGEVFKTRKYQFEREISQPELSIIRPWVDYSRVVPRSKPQKIRLYIHELFALDDIRKEQGGKRIQRLPEITEANGHEFKNHLDVSRDYLRAKHVKVRAMPEGDLKRSALHNMKALAFFFDRVMAMTYGEELPTDQEDLVDTSNDEYDEDDDEEAVEGESENSKKDQPTNVKLTKV